MTTGEILQIFPYRQAWKDCSGTLFSKSPLAREFSALKHIATKHIATKIYFELLMGQPNRLPVGYD